MELITINKTQALEIIETRQPKGLFLLPEANGTFTGIDNYSGNAWTENFQNQETALSWLNGEFEV